jgi:spermidine synthase
MSELLNSEAVSARPFHPFTRVSEATLIEVNEAVRRFCADHVRRLPSKGKTL